MHLIMKSWRMKPCSEYKESVNNAMGDLAKV